LKRALFPIFIGLILSLLQACGGGDGDGGSSRSGPTYDGLTSEARIEAANEESLSNAAASGATQSVVTDVAGESLSSRSGPNPEAKLVALSPKIAQWIVQSGTGYSGRETDLSADICDAGGSAIADTNADGSEGTITFSNCGIYDDIGDVIYFTGLVDFSGTYDSLGDPSTLSMKMYVTATYGGETAEINLTLNCVGLSGTPSCTVTSDFVGVDGRVYRVADITVTPTGAAYNVSATVYDPDNGYFAMTTSAPLAFDCSNGVPSTGTLEIAGEGGTSGTISFPDCSGFNVTIDGASNVYTWP
jgi:hypothetical protein